MFDTQHFLRPGPQHPPFNVSPPMWKQNLHSCMQSMTPLDTYRDAVPTKNKTKHQNTPIPHFLITVQTKYD